MREDERRKMMTTKQHQTAYVCRCRFSRTGATSFIGHLDLKTVFERAVRRAGLSMLYSQGFNPRPMLVFALPLGVGIDTTADYVDISMAEPQDPDNFRKKVNEELPEGLRIESCITIDEPKRSLMSVVTAACYTLEAPDISRKIISLFRMETVEIEKKSKGKIKTADIRPLMIKPVEAISPDKIEVMVYAGSVKNLRPDVLLSALVRYEGLDPEAASDCVVTRTGLFGGEYPDIEEIEGLV